MDRVVQTKEDTYQHNIELDLLKFISVWMVIFLHYSSLFLEKAVCIGGYICVEIFFIVSGYLMCTGLERIQPDMPIGISTAKFIGKKIKRLYPYVLVAFCVYYIPLWNGSMQLSGEIENQIWGILLLSQTGLGGGGAIGHTWYISVMLLGMTILVPILIFDKKNKIMFVYSPVIAAFCYAFLKTRYGTVQAEVYFLAADGIGIHPNLLRGIAGMCLGIFIYHISKLLKKVTVKRIYWSMKILEILLIGVCYGIIMQRHAFDYWDFITILLLMMIVFIAVSFEYKVKREKIYKIINYLGKLSLPLYLFQSTPAYVIKNMEQQHIDYKIKMLIFMTFLISLSVISIFFIEKLLPYLMKKIH